MISPLLIPAYRKRVRLANTRTDLFVISVSVMLLLAACQSVPRGQAAFERITLAERVPANGQLLLADLGGNEAPDILLMHRQPGRLSWFQNPDWQPQQLSLVADILFGVAAYRPPGHSGPASLALNGRFSQPGAGTRQQLIWLQNPGRSSPQADWPASLIRDDVKPGMLLWADMTGNGRQILVTLPDMVAFTLPQHLSRPWGGIPLIPDPLPVHRARVYDWDLDGRDDLIVAGDKGLDIVALASRGLFVDEFNLLAVNAEADASAAGAGFMDVGVGQSGRPALRFVATLTADGSQLHVYRPDSNNTRAWVGEIVAESLSAASALKVADLNGDSLDEIIVGHGDGLTVYYYDAALQYWHQYTIDSSVAVADLQIMDMTGSGFPDIVTAPAQPGPVQLFQNRLRD